MTDAFTTSSRPEEAFRQAILEKLGAAPETVAADGTLHRFATKPQGRDDNGWYVLYDDGLPAGSFGDWAQGSKFKWNAKSLSDLTRAEKARLDDLKAARNRRTEEAYAQAAKAAALRWRNAKPAGAEHPYLEKKRIQPHGLRENYGALLVPVYADDDKLISIQSIDADGAKLFAKGSKAAGGYYLIGSGSAELVIAEGFATAATINEATGLPVAVAFNAGNLHAVAKNMRRRFPDARIVIAADDDHKTPGNPGVFAAKKAAEGIGAAVVIPQFDRDAGEAGTDFNDLAATRGAGAVKEAFDAAFAASPEPDAGDVEIDRLARLDALAYDQAREAAAERLGCRVSTLDQLVEKKRGEKEEATTGGLFADVTPCAEPVDVAELLGEIKQTIRRFIVCEPSTATAAALWVSFTWIIDHAQVAPLAIVNAPEKGCGKTQLLSIIGRLSRRPLFASNISPAATYRVIEKRAPTLLIDEADSFFKENEELRGVINSGHTRDTAFVVRCVGDDQEPTTFATWGAKAIAGIGRLPETVMSRGVILTLRRKLKDEKVERLRHADPRLFDAINAKLARFAVDHGVAIGRARPELPEALGDRAQDNWEHLLAIADLAGGTWPKEARTAALVISGAEDGDLSIGEQLLEAVRDAFEQDNAEKLSREELLRRITADEEAPWATWNKGRPMSANQLRTRLSAYGISTKKVRLNTYETAQGFERKQFEDAWNRYLGGDDASPADPPKNWNIGTSETNQEDGCSKSVPVPKQEWNRRENGTDPSQCSTVPLPNSEWNAFGTLNGPENGECSNVPVETPQAGGRKALRI